MSSEKTIGGGGVTVPDTRRDLLKLGAVAFTTSIFTGNVKGANDRIRVSFIGVGRQGQGNMGSALQQPEVEIVSVCDVYQPNLEKAIARSARGPGNQARLRAAAKGSKLPRSARRQIRDGSGIGRGASAARDGFFEIRLIHVADRHDLHFRLLQRGPHIALTLPADADERDANAIVRTLYIAGKDRGSERHRPKFQ